ncbi:spore coat protein YsxE [Sutcliffiella cohnii]|uniref:spore coat protein YsxE n=1 Tax=Sutcliffiella cohnii TaxID=33932 RepID=UPI002E20FC14|nr:spore coat protein YsxE [Sutcliffiella cohnii]
MQTTNEQYAESILRQYGVVPELLQSYSHNVWRVGTKEGNYALKKINKNRAYALFMNIHSLSQRGVSSVVPIYKTQQGFYFIENQTDSYYLMPWVEHQEEREADFKDSLMFKELAKLHNITVKEKDYELDDITSFYEKTKIDWRQDEERLNQFVDDCEKKIYMSPFELQVCSFATEIGSALRFALQKLDSWYDEIKEAKKHRTAITHGAVSFHHFLKDKEGRGYFISWEKARKAAPANDLIAFYHRYLRTYPMFCDDCVDWYFEYSNAFPLKDHEKALALAYLAYPRQFISVLNKYIEEKRLNRRKGERKHVTHILESYWLAKNIEYVAGRISQIEEQKKMQSTQSSS